MKTEIEILKEVRAELDERVKSAESAAWNKTELARELKHISNHFYGLQRDLEKAAEGAPKVMAMPAKERPGA